MRWCWRALSAASVAAVLLVAVAVVAAASAATLGVAFVLSFFVGQEWARTILAQIIAQRVDLSPFPDELADWLRRGLQADPGMRYQDASQMRREWRVVMRELQKQQRRATRWTPQGSGMSCTRSARSPCASATP